jgi:hypothetical protein
VKPSGWVDGHPASSKLNLFEGFVTKIVNDLKANEELWEALSDHLIKMVVHRPVELAALIKQVGVNHAFRNARNSASVYC